MLKGHNKVTKFTFGNIFEWRSDDSSKVIVHEINFRFVLHMDIFGQHGKVGGKLNYIEEYWQQIENGEIVVSKKVRQQYQKLINDLIGHEQYIFDQDKAERPIHFIEAFLKHSKGKWAGTKIELELFQKAFISALFGFVDKVTGFRRYNETFFLVARKNAKTTLMAGIALYMLIADGEGGADVFSLASKLQQAKLLFDEAHNMVQQSPHLTKHLKKRKSDLYFPATFSKMQPLAKNSNTLDGLSGHLIVIDEVHSISDRNLYEVMKQSMSARQQPILAMITTAGTIRGSIYDDLYNYACKVVDGTFDDDRFLAILYELDDKSEWTEPTAWQKANPALGTIKRIDDLEAKVERAKNNPSELSGLLCKDFNIRETNAKAWLPFDAINNEETFDLERFRNHYAIGGADLSITTDLSCATLLFIDKETEKRYVHQMYWIPEDSFSRRVELDKIPYDKWKEQGRLRLCAGNTINYSDITAWFVEMLNDYGITPLWIYYDSYSARYWVDEMQQYGFKMVRCIQGARTLSLPMQQMGADFEAGKIIYDNNPILKWCLTNTGVEQDRNGNIVPIKSQSPKMRIDGTASLLDAYVGLMDHYEEFLRAQ